MGPEGNCHNGLFLSYSTGAQFHGGAERLKFKIYAMAAYLLRYEAQFSGHVS